jgi:hypothetical protein
MADSKSTTGVEREQADRFTKARASYLVWTSQQGENLRKIRNNEQNNTGNSEQQGSEDITAKFNE